MRTKLTWRRLIGFGLAVAGFTLLGVGSSLRQPLWALVGLVALGLFAFGLIWAVLQRTMVLLRLAADTRSDSTRALALQEALPSLLKKRLIEQQSVILAELRHVSELQARHSSALVLGIERSVNEMREQHQKLDAKLFDLVGAVKETQSKQDTLRRLMREGSATTQRIKTEIVREIEALMQLRQLLDAPTPLPLLGDWAMDPEAMLSLVKIILDREPQCVIELGSGSSTLWLAMALRRVGKGRLISYDHLNHCAALTKKGLREHGLDSWAEVRVADLKPTEIEGVNYPWYDIDRDSLEGPIDLLIVDGPPGGTGPMARFPALPMLRDLLAEDAVIVIDDSLRPDEKQMSSRWMTAFPELLQGSPLGARTAVLMLGSSSAIPTGT